MRLFLRLGFLSFVIFYMFLDAAPSCYAFESSRLIFRKVSNRLWKCSKFCFQNDPYPVQFCKKYLVLNSRMAPSSKNRQSVLSRLYSTVFTHHMLQHYKCASSTHNLNRNPATQSEADRTSKLWALYISHFFSTWSDRMWEFAVPFFLFGVNRSDNIYLISSYALVTGTTNIALGPIIGFIVERLPRLPTLIFTLLAQNVLMSISFLMLYTVLCLSSASGMLALVMVGFVVLFCTTASLASTASAFAIERDWLKCLSNGDIQMNNSKKIFSRISVLCRMGAPMLVGLVFATWPARLSIAGIAVTHMLLGLIDFSILKHIYFTTPQLSAKKVSKYIHLPVSQRPLSATETLTRMPAGSRRLVEAYKAAWRDYLDINGDGRIDRSELYVALLTGIARCWDLWVGCIVGAMFSIYIEHILMLPFP